MLIKMIVRVSIGFVYGFLFGIPFSLISHYFAMTPGAAGVGFIVGFILGFSRAAKKQKAQAKKMNAKSTLQQELDKLKTDNRKMDNN